ncbi:unnamed protein product, partial [Symbiodinium necroappetens]
IVDPMLQRMAACGNSRTVPARSDINNRCTYQGVTQRAAVEDQAREISDAAAFGLGYKHLQDGRHTLCTRLLLAVIPSVLYVKEETMDGVNFKGRNLHFHFAYTGTKGDWPFLRSGFKLNCGFNCRRKCHLCDISEWWDVKGEIKHLPADYVPDNPFKVGLAPSPLRSLSDEANKIRVDAAHTWAINGIGKDLYSSTLVLGARMGFFGAGSMDERLKVAYSRFDKFCRAQKKYTSIDAFNHMTLKTSKMHPA